MPKIRLFLAAAFALACFPCRADGSRLHECAVEFLRIAARDEQPSFGFRMSCPIYAEFCDRRTSEGRAKADLRSGSIAIVGLGRWADQFRALNRQTARLIQAPDLQAPTLVSLEGSEPFCARLERAEHRYQARFLPVSECSGAKSSAAHARRDYELADQDAEMLRNFVAVSAAFAMEESLLSQDRATAASKRAEAADALRSCLGVSGDVSARGIMSSMLKRLSL